MGRLVALFVAGMGFLIAGSLGASAPVKVTITGCVTGGVLVTEKTDFGTHISEGEYRIRPFVPSGEPLDLAAHEGERIIMTGHLLPGDRFYAYAKSLRVLGPCTATAPPPESSRVYHGPTYKDIRVDRCWRSGDECDQVAADRFCRMHGYAGSADWAHAAHRPTYVIGDNRVCDESFCEGFTYIRCGGPK
ncbi:MAG: hypothetical protein QM256_09310 [Pseudomonadota bacterium]|jgi:hypothetical protein|nr:hypothetical protein [Syntrophaceae bacterium]MDI9555963.1 hypothetical protein [Pseudomonadota bacterium]NLX31561.1 hypothetical protein [Deltaproteobacteria bacterium]HNU84791.1 hypothetical protein [Syntrophales bacterium]HNZ34007.1 hypothetical protein [Syntrophales bacterium]